MRVSTLKKSLTNCLNSRVEDKMSPLKLMVDACRLKACGSEEESSVNLPIYMNYSLRYFIILKLF